MITVYMLCLILFSVGLYCVLRKRNLIKIIIGIGIMEYAVNLFFVLSGYVLTRSFERHLARPSSQVLARIVRLGLPALAAALVAAALMLCFGRPNVAAGALSGSAWFAGHWNTDVSFLSVLRDGTVNALFLGAGAGFERFVYRSWAVDGSARYSAIFLDGTTNHEVQFALGMIFYAAY